jgi:hypothetical protein
LQHQPDIRENGRLFSYALIYFMNVFGIGLWIVMVASPTLEGFADSFGKDILWSWEICRLYAIRIWSFAQSVIARAR